jgi:hypothetical protein
LYQSKSKQTLLTLPAKSSTPSTWVFSQQASQELLIKMIIAHKQPFTFVEQPLFRAFVKSLQPQFKLFSRGTLKTKIMVLHGSMKDKLIKEIAEVDRIALSTNLWTSSNQTPFVVISAHFISSDWTLKNCTLSFKQIPPPHTNIAIGDQLVATMVEWNIINKFAFITVDNASSNNVTIN